MRDLCMRSACLGPADVLVVMDVSDLTFTIHDLDEVDGPGAVVLCATHIDRLRAPVGWDLVDARGVGTVIPLPARPMTTDEAADMAGDRSNEVLRPVAEVEPIRPDVRSKAAIHPLEKARQAVVDADEPAAELIPDTEETPLLARAFLGVDRHPATGVATPAGSGGQSGEEPLNHEDPFASHQWDQSDEWDTEMAASSAPETGLPVGPQMTGQLTFGGDPVT